MNYRHDFHAGNHTEVFKHAALVLLLSRLLAKPKPFMVLDTHAGSGIYDLAGPEATRTGEARHGVERVKFKGLLAARPYGEAVRKYLGRGLYPGSPTIVADAIRAQDRLVACELQVDAAARLRRLFTRDDRVSVHRRDGYEAVLGLVPPMERRGLVFIDPPFERPDEADRLAERLATSAKKWPTGLFAAWYPIKDCRIASVISDRLSRSGLPNVLRAELLRDRVDGLHLAGGGMVFINPPWGFLDELEAAAEELLEAMGCPEGSFASDWIAPPQ